MITIKKIEIKGYFGRGDFEWNLDPFVNILGGKNGSGKSSIFKLCHLLLSNERIEDNIDKKFSNIFEKVVITLSNGWTQTWTRAEKDESYSVDLSYTKPLVFRDATRILDEKGKARSFSELKELTKVFFINSFEQHTAQAARYEQQPKSEPLDDPIMLDLMIKDQIDIRNKDFSKVMEDFVDSSYDEETKRSEYIKQYKQIYHTLSSFLKGYKEPFKSSFIFTKGNQQISYEHLSMGEKQILLLMLMVSNTKQEPCIFFMDEPDLSMHIDWKEILVNELHNLNSNMQIILSTHAPSVITGWHDRVKEVGNLIK